MANKVIRGKFSYDGDNEKKKKSKKQRRKEEEKLMKIKDKQIKMQCECNHLDRQHNKTHFKMSDDGNMRICKICGGELIARPELLTPDIVSSAVGVIYTVLGIARNRLNVNEETDEAITNALRINSRATDLLMKLQSEHYESKKKKGKKKNGKKGKKKNKNKFSRIQY